MGTRLALRSRDGDCLTRRVTDPCGSCAENAHRHLSSPTDTDDRYPDLPLEIHAALRQAAAESRGGPHLPRVLTSTREGSSNTITAPRLARVSSARPLGSLGRGGSLWFRRD